MADKILIIEDDPGIRSMLEGKLKSSGFQVVMASDGQQAIDLYKKEKPGLLFVDLIIPKKSGFQVIEEIRFKLHSEVPIIVLTNLDQQQDRETAKRLGVSEYIVKSNVSLRDLMILVKQLLL
jgi:DNA-binding response OmpR family regulator